MGGIEIPQIVLIPVGQLAEVPLQLVPQLVQRAGIRPGPLRHPFQRVQNPLEQLGGEDRRAQIEIFQGNGHPLDLGGRLGHGITELFVFVFGDTGGTMRVLDRHEIPPSTQCVQVLLQLLHRVLRKMGIHAKQCQQFRLVQPDMGLLRFQVEGAHDGPVAPGVLRREIAGFGHAVQGYGVKLHRSTPLSMAARALLLVVITSVPDALSDKKDFDKIPHELCRYFQINPGGIVQYGRWFPSTGVGKHWGGFLHRFIPIQGRTM